MRIDTLIKEADLAQKVQPELARLKKSAQGVEAMFVKDLLSAMRRSVPESSGSQAYGGDVFRDMFDQAFADSLGQSGALGIGKMVYASLAKAVVGSARTAYAIGAPSAPRTEPTDINA